MRLLLVVVAVLLPLHADKITFITKQEYASQLYHNPRGVGCDRCHGDDASGKQIATYKHRNKAMVFSAPSLHEQSLQGLISALNRPIHGMPRYFLTDKEIAVLYFYIQMQKKERKK